MVYRLFAKRCPCKQLPLLGNTRNIYTQQQNNEVMKPVSEQWLAKYVPVETNTSVTIEEQCFLFSPPRGYTVRTPGWLNAVQLDEMK
jgi:hypothetical protein